MPPKRLGCSLWWRPHTGPACTCGKGHSSWTGRSGAGPVPRPLLMGNGVCSSAVLTSRMTGSLVLCMENERWTRAGETGDSEGHVSGIAAPYAWGRSLELKTAPFWRRKWSKNCPSPPPLWTVCVMNGLSRNARGGDES